MMEVRGGVGGDGSVKMIEGILEVEDRGVGDARRGGGMEGEGSSGGWGRDKLCAKEIRPEVGMTGSEMGFWRVGRAGTGFLGKLMGVDMKEMKMTTFKGGDVIEPRVVGRMGSRGDGRFECLEVEGGKINNVVHR